MKLQPLDIRRQSFAKAFRGYEPVEVDAFLKQVADQQAALMEELRLMEDRVRDAEAKLKHYERVELALQEALETARESGKRAEATAERELRAIVQRAEARAEEILRDAERERFALQQDVRKLSTRQTEVAAKLRGFLMSELEILAQFQGDDPVGFLKLQPASMPAALPPAADAPPSDLHVPADESVDAAPDAAPDDADLLIALDQEPDDAPGEAGLADALSDAAPADDVPDDVPDPPAAREDAPATDPPAAETPPDGAPSDRAPETDAPAPSAFKRWFGTVPSPPPVPGALPDDAPPAPSPASVPAPPEPLAPAEHAPTEVVADAPVDAPAEPPPPPSFAPLPPAEAPSGAPPVWDLRSLVTGAADDANVAGSEAERDRIRRILDDLD